MPDFTNVRVVSNGTGADTRVLVDGVPMSGVFAVKWELTDPSGLGVLTLSVEGVAVEIESADGPTLAVVNAEARRLHLAGWDKLV